MNVTKSAERAQTFPGSGLELGEHGTLLMGLPHMK